ncbi:MAG: hypothetical protein N3A66_06940 [Planctomycetota bacterium]|nr:hypothetical protein [Planctomycetota bacterium]
MSYFRDDQKWSAEAFASIVWPEIKDICGGGEIMQVEGREQAIMDIYAGIDAWQIFREQSAIRGIASRIQCAPDWPCARYPYNTFTIRLSRPHSPTEYQKRMEAIFSNRGMIYPHLTVQAYLDKTKTQLLSVAVIETRELYTFIEKHGIETFTRNVNYDGSSDFIVIDWDALRGEGARIRIKNNLAAVVAASGQKEEET